VLHAVKNNKPKGRSTQRPPNTPPQMANIRQTIARITGPLAARMSNTRNRLNTQLLWQGIQREFRR
jgi:hypothetical protein